MDSPEEISLSEGAAFPWILEHLLTYPGTYDIPLRTMYTLNATTQDQHYASAVNNSIDVPGNAFPLSRAPGIENQYHAAPTTAAAQLQANLVSHISQLPSQPTSLPPSFITTFVRRCFPTELARVEFPHALTALDYLKDLEVRRRREVVAALDRLGIERTDISDKDVLAQKYPGVLEWMVGIEEKERQVEALYTQVYVGIRRWTLINELSLLPFNKANCIAMLNTLYPPISINSSQIIQPTAQLTPQILGSQRNGFFRYITAVEKKGPIVLSSLIDQHKRPGEATGWQSLQETVNNYLDKANNIIDECYEITGHLLPPANITTGSHVLDENARRQADSGMSFGSANSSNRSSGQSHATALSSNSSNSLHSRKVSREKPLPAEPITLPLYEEHMATPKPAGSTLERIARELRKIRSKNNLIGVSRPRAASAASPERMEYDGQIISPSSPSRGRTIRLKRSLMKMTSNGKLREGNVSRSGSRSDDLTGKPLPLFDASEMKQQRGQWEAQQRVRTASEKMDLD